MILIADNHDLILYIGKSIFNYKYLIIRSARYIVRKFYPGYYFLGIQNHTQEHSMPYKVYSSTTYPEYIMTPTTLWSSILAQFPRNITVDILAPLASAISTVLEIYNKLSKSATLKSIADNKGMQVTFSDFWSSLIERGVKDPNAQEVQLKWRHRM